MKTRCTGAILLATLLLTVGCRSHPTRVAVGIALTESNHPAVELAAREINAAGGINGVPLQLIGLEWRVREHFKPDEIFDWSTKFSQTSDLLAVVGHSDSASTLSAAAVYNQEGVPQIVTIATNPDITNIGTWTYRLCISDAVQGPALARYSVQDWGKKRIAVFYVNDAYGIGLSQVFEKEARTLGAEIVASVIHRNTLKADDQEMIRLTAKRLLNNKPDLFVLFQRIPAAQWTVGALRDAGFDTDILGGDSLSPAGFIGKVADKIEGMRISEFFVPDEGNPRVRRFIDSMRDIEGIEPDYARAMSYDAVYLVRDAVAHGGFSRKGVKQYLDRLIGDHTVIEGVGGPFTLGSDHDARRKLSIVEVRGGKRRPLKRLPLDD